jgi:general transcription factor 3C polypeptide 1
MTFWLWVWNTFWVKFSEFKNKLYFIHYFSHYLKFQDHPIRKHYLVKILPPDIRNKLLFHRKYIFTAFELATRLAFIGVVQFGPQKLKEKDQVRLRNTRITFWSKKFRFLYKFYFFHFSKQKFKFKIFQIFLYLNTKASLYDTTSSAKGYHQVEEKEYTKRSFTFDRLQDIVKYWLVQNHLIYYVFLF